MRSLYRGNDELRFSELAQLEFLSVMSRKCRAGEFSNEFRRDLISRFSHDRASRFKVLSISAPVIEEAAIVIGTAGETTPIRSLDAIQAACYNVYCDIGVVLLSSDKRLNLVVERSGRSVLDPAAG